MTPITLLLFSSRSWKVLGNAKEVRLFYAVFLMLSLTNCFSMILVEMPRLYWRWTANSLLFGVRLCQFLWIATPIIETIQISVLCGLSSAIWSNQRKQKLCSGLFWTFFTSLGILSMTAASQLYQPQVACAKTLA